MNFNCINLIVKKELNVPGLDVQLLTVSLSQVVSIFEGGEFCVCTSGSLPAFCMCVHQLF